MRYYATYFDSNYLSRGLLLLSSLRSHSREEFTLFILCLDKESEEFFCDQPHASVETITLGKIEQYFPQLEQARSNRNRIEYYFTLSPYLPIYLLENFPEIDQISTMDADLYFYSDPAEILDAYPDCSVLISPHKFTPGLKHLEIFGRYNVSFQSFRNDPSGKACLENWASKCLEWCYDHYDEEGQRFADQKYLDTWTEEFEHVQEIRLPGAAIAPWNVGAADLAIRGTQYYANGDRLIFYHFHHLRILSAFFASHGLEYYQVDTGDIAVRNLYLDYIVSLKKSERNIGQNDRKIIRGNRSGNAGLLNTLRNPDGGWLYYSGRIKHINFERGFQSLKQHIKGIWQN